MTDITELAKRVERIISDVKLKHGGNDTYAPIMKWDEFSALVEALEEAQSANECLREQSAEWERKAISNFEDCAEMSARIEELESQRKLAFTASNRWADKFREAEKRIAKLESRTVTVKQGEVLVTVAGFTGCGKSAIAGEIEIAMKAIGVPVTWANGDSEKRMTGADWLTAIEMYKPTVRIVEVNIPRAAGIKVGAE